MSDGVGPIWAAGFQHITSSGYELLYLPDLHNDELQREGKPPIYWWLPNAVRLARQNGDTGDYRFRFINFAGVLDESTNVGIEGHQEVAGGLLALSTTSAPPGNVLEESQKQLLDRFRGSDDKYWGWRTNVAPAFRPAPIMDNTTSITNLSPGPGGSVPVPAPPAGGAVNGNRALGRPRSIVPSLRAPDVPTPRSVPMERAMRGAGLDMWYCNVQGQGAGSVSPFAENAYSAMVGTIPAAMIWSAFHGASGAICVWQNLRIKVWAPAVHIHIHGDWSRVQEHYSGAVHAGGWFWSADIQAEFNNMRQNGTIEVVVEVDTSLPGADKLAEEIDKRSELVFQKFMEQAQKTIFDPAPFNEKPAEASGGFLGFGGGAAFKLRQDRVSLTLDYDERREMAYNQSYPISGQLDGIYQEIQADPANEKKYFSRIDLGDMNRKLTRVIKPVLNWPDPAKQWAGMPVSFLSAQIGYPNEEGAVQWTGHVFQRQDGPDASWSTSTLLKHKEDVTSPPAGWAPDKTFVKRAIHFAEPPNASEYPFVKVQIEQNVVDLDPGELGSALNDTSLEVRVDSVGILSVGPISLNVALDAGQMVEVTFQALGKTTDGHDRDPVRMTWNAADQNEPRYWMVFTGQPDFVPKYTYQVRVIVKGTIFSKGKEWTGAVQQAGGGGDFTISVPMADDPTNVSSKDLVWTGARAPAVAAAHNGAHAGPPHPAVTAGTGRTGPPSTGPRRLVTPARALTPAAVAPRELSGWPVDRPHDPETEGFRDIAPKVG